MRPAIVISSGDPSGIGPEVTAKALHDHVYSAGGSRDPEELYKSFRGRLPTVDALLRKRGLVDA